MYFSQTDGWYLERIIWLIAGAFCLTSLTLSFLFSPYWLILAGLVGVNLIIFALTGFCLMANFLYWLGAKPKLKREAGCARHRMKTNPIH